MQIIIAGYVSIWGGGRRGICVDMSIRVDMGWRKREDMCRYGVEEEEGYVSICGVVLDSR
jgi:hypothetical protein